MVFSGPRRPGVSILLGLVLIAGVSGCSRVREQVVTAANRDAVTSGVVQSSLPEEDKRLFLAFVARMSAGYDHGQFSQTKASYDGQTVGAIIEQERVRLSMARAGQEQRAAEAEATQAGAVALAAAIGKALAVTVLDLRTAQFGAVPSSYLKLVAENISGKDVTGFKGRLTVRDVFGDEVAHAAVVVTDTIKAGAKMTWEEVVSDGAVGATAARHFKFEWVPEQIVFQDGSQLGPVKPATR
jgi:hypothetical protein